MMGFKNVTGVDDGLPSNIHCHALELESRDEYRFKALHKKRIGSSENTHRRKDSRTTTDMKISCFTSAMLAGSLSLSTAIDVIELPKVDKASEGVVAPLRDVEEAPTPVNIKVTCPGVDFSKLTLISTLVASRVLESSYNDVSEYDDVDDSDLSNVGFVSSASKAFGTFTALWGCESCAKDEADEIKAWENQFVAGLLESKNVAFRKVKTCKIEMTYAVPPTETAYNAFIDIACDNIDPTKIGIAKGTFLAHTVQRTYNKVHGDATDDDSTLSSSFYRGYAKPKKVDSDELQQSRPRRYKYTPGVGSTSGCRYCPPNDDDMLTVAVSGPALDAWEAEFTKELRTGPFEFFRKVTSCKLKLLPRVSAVETEDVASLAAPRAIRGGCGMSSLE